MQMNKKERQKTTKEEKERDMQKRKNIQQRGFASGHPPNY